MVKFCSCGSIIIDGSCTNKKCEHHIKGTELASYRQIEYIKEMQKLLQDDQEYDFKNMTQKEASKLITELGERWDLEG